MHTDSFIEPLEGSALAQTWDVAWSELGRPAPSGLRGELQLAWSEPHRHYHDAGHLGKCLALWSRWQAQAEHPGDVAIAVVPRRRL